MHPVLAELVEPFERMPRAEASRLLAEHYGLDAVELEHLDTERDDSLRVSAGGTHYVLKVAHPADDPAVIEMQTAAMEHVAATDPGIPVARVVPSLTGASVVRVGGRSARLLTWLPGELARGQEPTPSQLHAAGAMLGRLNLALASFEHPAAHRALAWDLRQLTLLRELATDATAHVIDRFERSVAPQLDSLPQQVIHNDFHPANILVDDKDPAYVVGVLDFGDVVFGARVNDLGVALAYLAPQGDLLTGVAPFIDGFQSVVPLVLEEKAILPDLVSARLVQRIVLSGLLGRVGPATGE
jgi:Ser/Thr protein kinase RdoA (MazF antagonist)